MFVNVLGYAKRTENRLHADHLGTPRAITRPSDNAVVWRWENRDPFGSNQPNEDPANTGTAFKYNLRFPGQYYDQETGTHYNYFRDYDPNTGRYVQSDPIGLKGGINTYSYVNNDPLHRIDPRGLADETPDWRSTPPGKCSPERYAVLVAIKLEACSKPFSCRGIKECGEIARRTSNAYACLQARKNVMNECFGGGDAAHRGAVDDVNRAIGRCIKNANENTAPGGSCCSPTPE